MARPPNRLRQGGVIVLFFGVLYGTAIVDLLRPMPERVAVGQEAASADGPRFADGSWTRAMEERHKERSRVRLEAGSSLSAILLAAWGRTDPPLLVGERGWLFRDGLSDHAHPADEVVRTLAAVQRRFAALGVRLWVLPLPSRFAVLSDLTSRKGEPADLRWYGELQAGLLLWGVDGIDVLPVLSGPDREALWFQTDSHWSYEGAHRVAERVASVTGYQAEPKDRWGGLAVTGRRHDAGNLLDWVGIPANRVLGGRPVAWVLERFGNLRTIDVWDVVDPTTGKAQPGEGSRESANLWVAGTSFSGVGHFGRFLFHATGGNSRTVSSPGGGAVGALEGAIAGRTGPWPKDLVWEFPAEPVGRYPESLTRLLQPSVLPTAAGVFTAVPRSPIASAAGEPDAGGEGSTVRVDLRGWDHPGDGRLAVKLSGPAAPGDRRVHVSDGVHRRDFTWPSGEQSLLVPLLFGSGEEVQVTVAGGWAFQGSLCWDLDWTNRSSIPLPHRRPDIPTSGERRTDTVLLEIPARTDAAVIVGVSGSDGAERSERVGGEQKDEPRRYLWSWDAIRSLELAPGVDPESGIRVWRVPIQTTR